MHIPRSRYGAIAEVPCPNSQVLGPASKHWPTLWRDILPFFTEDYSKVQGTARTSQEE